MNLSEEKNRLRIELKQARNHLSKQEHAWKSNSIIKQLQKIPEFVQAKSFFCYLSYSSEVDTHPIITSLLERGCSLSAPKIISAEEMIAVPLTNLDDLKSDRMGILTPVSRQITTDPFDVSITPCLACTLQGGRLGYGRGYYDRWFSNHAVKTKIGIAFELQLVEKLPMEKTDIPLNIIVTENRIINLKK